MSRDLFRASLSIRDDREVLPEESITVPVSHLYRATLAGGWLRPRLTLQAKEPGALGEVPGEENGTVQFWYARRDRTVALAMAAAVNDAIAAASLPDRPSGARYGPLSL